ncbi:MAG: hypothetical protein ACRENS_12080, partial [Candidatus Eiseniibacteriota bacterium]
MNRRAPVLSAFSILSIAFCPLPARAQIAAPGDVYYQVHAVHRFQYGVFAGDYVPWADDTRNGTSLSFATSHDTSTVAGMLGIASSYSASAGILTADMSSYLSDSARTGLYN